jgi:hypothetical protein
MIEIVDVLHLRAKQRPVRQRKRQSEQCLQLVVLQTCSCDGHSLLLNIKRQIRFRFILITYSLCLRSPRFVTIRRIVSFQKCELFCEYRRRMKTQSLLCTSIDRIDSALFKDFLNSPPLPFRLKINTKKKKKKKTKNKTQNRKQHARTERAALPCVR